jgi:hypothetical protein
MPSLSNRPLETPAAASTLVWRCMAPSAPSPRSASPGGGQNATGGDDEDNQLLLR